MKFLYKLAIIGLMMLSLFACDKGIFPTPISTILNNARDYDGKVVKVSGTVTQSMNLVFVKYFALRDETGEIIIITDKILPRQGNSISVKGHVEEAFTIGTEQLIVIIEDTEKL